MIARLAVIAAFAGSAIGATVVLADEQAPPPKVPAVRAVAKAEPTPPPIEARDAKLLLQTPDPDGDPPWALRSFVTAGDARCYEVGRLQGERFGWIDAHGTFTPSEPGQSSGTCLTAKQLAKVGAITQRYSTITSSATGSPEPSRTISLVVPAPGVKTVTPPGEPAIDASKPYLQVVKGELPVTWLRMEIERGDGTTTTTGEFGGYRGERTVPGTGVVAARAPDPAGGLPWGRIAYTGEKGGTCLGSPGRLVGTHIGFVDEHRGVFFADALGAMANCTRKPPTRAFPLRLDTLISSGGLDDRQGAIERRIVSGRIVFSGTVHPDVTSVTITTPRDIRTLVPTKQHAIIAVYAGLFPGGKATATAHFDDGHEVTRTLYVE